MDTKSTINDLVGESNECVSDDIDKAELLNNCFCSVFTSEDSNSLPSFGVSSSISFIRTIDISLSTVHYKLSKVDVSKSPGPDGWPPVILKETADSISLPLPLYLIFVKSLDHGLVPSSWKKGCVSPIFKKGARNLPQNYRPITLTSIVGKMVWAGRVHVTITESTIN